MKRYRRRGHAVAAAALAAGACTAAQAHAVDVTLQEPAWAAAELQPQAAIEPELVVPQRVVLAAAEGTRALPLALSFSSSLPDIGLWKFIASIRSIQQATPLHVLESQVRILEISSTVPAAVPLPGAAWFMVMGLLGMAGVRLTGRREGAPSLQAGSAQPA